MHKGCKHLIKCCTKVACIWLIVAQRFCKNFPWLRRGFNVPKVACIWLSNPCTKVAGKCYEKTNCRFCRSMNFHIISLRKIKIRRGHWWITFLNVHFFCREDLELVEALDIEEAGGGDEEEEYWANTVILQQTLFFYPFFRLNVFINILSLLLQLPMIYISCQIRFPEVEIDRVKNVVLVPLLGQRLREFSSPEQIRFSHNTS